MSKEQRDKLHLNDITQQDDLGKKIPIVRVTKSNDKYLVENIENPSLFEIYDSPQHLKNELLLGVPNHSSADFDDQTGEDIFKDYSFKD